MEEIKVNGTDFPRELIEQEAARIRLRRAEILKREADEEHDAAIQEWHRACGAVQEWQSEHRPESETPFDFQSARVDHQTGRGSNG